MAADKLKVKLTKRIAGIGLEGAIVEVSHAQAKNYLIPKGFAVMASDTLIELEAAKKKKQAEARVRNLEDRAEVAKILHTKEILISMRGKGESIFGGIGEHEIIVAVKKAYGIELEKKNILLPNGSHIKKVGSTDIKIHISEDTYIRMAVVVSVIA